MRFLGRNRRAERRELQGAAVYRDDASSPDRKEAMAEHPGERTLPDPKGNNDMNKELLLLYTKIPKFAGFLPNLSSAWRV